VFIFLEEKCFQIEVSHYANQAERRAIINCEISIRRMINEPQLPVLAKGRGALSSAIFLPGSGCHFAGIVVARWQEGSRCQENCGIHNGTNNHLPNGLLKDSSTFGP